MMRFVEFEWDPAKAASNERKHGVSFEIASTVFHDPMLLTVPDLEHDTVEERWFSIGFAANGSLIAVAYLLFEVAPSLTKIRVISARRATQSEIRHYTVR